MGALFGYNIVASRIDATGGQHSFACESNCTVTDSWLHGQWNPEPADCPSNMPNCSFHNNAFISNGGSHFVVKHNTLHCDTGETSNGGSCSGDVSFFGDFAQVTDALIEGNLLKANPVSIAFCVFGGYQPAKAYPVSTYIRVVNNVFERGPNGKCGAYGPVTSFLASATGNSWSGNVWDDGTVVGPST
jgi:hypothetical protein